jgi:ATP-dependent Clp protease ATP-binding subunit ClpA
MYERFTDRARKVMLLANREAQRFNHEYIGTEHILLGLVQDAGGVAGNVLKNLDISLHSIRVEVERIVHPGPGGMTTGRMPQTPRAEKVIEYAIDEARNLGHHYIGTEHVLLGLLAEEEGIAAQVLMNMGLRRDMVREEIVRLVGPILSDPAEIAPADVPNPLLVPQDETADLPAEVQQAVDDLNARIEQLNGYKESAIAEQDFEMAAHQRDQADRLKREKRSLLRTWHLQYPIEPAWLTWNGGSVPKMAEVIAAERRWEDLPILADALEESGCTHAEMLRHCRAATQHTARCWVVDLLRNF